MTAQRFTLHRESCTLSQAIGAGCVMGPTLYFLFRGMFGMLQDVFGR